MLNIRSILASARNLDVAGLVFNIIEVGSDYNINDLFCLALSLRIIFSSSTVKE